MHIGLLAAALPDSGAPTGVVTYVKILREALLALGHDVTVVAGDQVQNSRGEIWRLPEPRGLRVQIARIADRLWARPGAEQAWPAKIAERLLEAHRHEGFDTLEIEEAYGISAALVPHAPFPVVVRLHGPHIFGRDAIESDSQRIAGEGRIGEEKRAIVSAAAITSPSSRLMTATLAHYGLSLPLAEVIPNPVEASSAEQRWSIDRCDPKQLLWVGRFDLRKGADILLAAFALAAAKDPDLTLLMAGRDAGLRIADGTELRFADYAKAYLPPEIGARIRFLGAIPPEHILELRRASGPAIVASRFENFAYSIAESMAIGAPTIVSDSFGNGEMIENGRSGVVVPIGDANRLADAILSLTADPAKMAAMGLHAWERCRDWLSPVRIAEETIALHKRALDRFSRR